MIDLHTHILPELDDGADSIEEALSMARIAVEDGITALVATPHVIDGLFSNSKEKIHGAVERLDQRLKEDSIPLELLPGAEYNLEPDLAERLSRGELLTLNNTGRYLLVELPATLVPHYTDRVLYELQLQGITPILAHPERNIEFSREPSRLAEMVSKGILVQVTAGSITGSFGREIKNLAHLFLKSGCAHFIASDAHSSTGRIPKISSAMKEIENVLGPDMADELAVDNPRRAIEGQRIRIREPQEIRPARGGFLKGLRNIFFHS